MRLDRYAFSNQVVWQRGNSNFNVLILTSGLGLYRNYHLIKARLDGHSLIIHNDQPFGIYPFEIDASEIGRCCTSYIDDYIERFPSYDARGDIDVCDGNSFVNRNLLRKIQWKVPGRLILRMKRRVHICLILPGGWEFTSRGFVENRVVARWGGEWCHVNIVCGRAIAPTQINSNYVTSQLLKIYSGDLQAIVRNALLKIRLIPVDIEKRAELRR